MQNDPVTIKKTDAARQMIWTEVYVPMVPDSQGDWMTAHWIEKTAYDYMRRMKLYNVDTEHDLEKNDSVVVESFIARPGDPDFVPGSWVIGLHIPNADRWASVEKGELNAISMYGSGRRIERILEIEIPDDGLIKGDTHLADDHQHEFFLQFGNSGFIDGHTSEVNGHTHLIKGGTITEMAAGHAHRYSMSDALAKLTKQESA